MKQAIAATVRHLFTIKEVGKLPGLFGARRYLYHCARCKWSFVVNDGRRGVLTPIGDHGEQLAHDEAVARAATFALGPCPAMRVLHEAMPHLNGAAHVNGANSHAPAHSEPAVRSEERGH
jgi:hypothetical protein